MLLSLASVFSHKILELVPVFELVLHVTLYLFSNLYLYLWCTVTQYC